MSKKTVKRRKAYRRKKNSPHKTKTIAVIKPGQGLEKPTNKREVGFFKKDILKSITISIIIIVAIYLISIYNLR